MTLEPNVPQTIRVLVRKPRDLPPGEYRSHMLFRALPGIPAGQSAEGLNGTHGLSVQLVPIYGVTIRVIVRHGNLGADLAITGAELQPVGKNGASSAVNVRLARSGERSIYGHVKISLLGEDSGEQLIGEVRGVAVYSPNRSRTVRIPIDPDLARQVKGRRIKIGFVTLAKAGGRTLAENQFVIR